MSSPKKLKPQSLLVLDFLKTGRGLSNLIALVDLGVGSLSSRVAELRDAGYDIIAKSHKTPNGKRFNVYRLNGEREMG